MSTFPEARLALIRAMRAVFPRAKPVPRWAGVEAWGAPRPEGVVDLDAPGTYDPKLTVIGIADRKSGPTIYFLDPGDYFVLDTHRALLEEAGFKLGRGCIMHTRKAPLPADALAELFRRVKARDAKDARSTEKTKAAVTKAARRGTVAKVPVPKRGSSPKDVEAYFAALPTAQRNALQKLRAQILAAAPEATEKMSWGMPTFVHEGNLAHVAAFRDHLSFFPGVKGVEMALASGIEGLDTSKGTIRFTPEKPLPAALVKRIVKMRIAENEADAAKRAMAKRAKKAAPAAKKATVKKARRA